MKINKNSIKTAYESVRKTWKNFWNDDETVGLVGLVLLMLSLGGPIHEEPENKFRIYKKFEPVQEEYMNIEQENKYNKLILKDFKNYINNLPEEERERIIDKYMNIEQENEYNKLILKDFKIDNLRK